MSYYDKLPTRARLLRSVHGGAGACTLLPGGTTRPRRLRGGCDFPFIPRIGLCCSSSLPLIFVYSESETGRLGSYAIGPGGGVGGCGLGGAGRGAEGAAGVVTTNSSPPFAPMTLRCRSALGRITATSGAAARVSSTGAAGAAAGLAASPAGAGAASATPTGRLEAVTAPAGAGAHGQPGGGLPAATVVVTATDAASGGSAVVAAATAAGGWAKGQEADGAGFGECAHDFSRFAVASSLASSRESCSAASASAESLASLVAACRRCLLVLPLPVGRRCIRPRKLSSCKHRRRGRTLFAGTPGQQAARALQNRERGA